MEANTLFDFPKVEITKPIRLIEAFGGIGSQAMALRDIGANFEHYRLIEFDKYAVASYNAIHGTAFETMDIRDVHADDLGITECDKYTYIMTYSFPCTDLSVAGKMKGMSKADWENGNSTRSGLLWEVERILKECKKEELPQILLMENVPQVHAEQNMADFESWLSFLRSKGYHNHWQDLNAKDYGIPQHRNRCFCVSILANEFVDYEFPSPIPLTTEMKDYLEDTVGEKYYINTGKAKALIQNLLTNNQENQICVQINYNNVGKIGCKVAKALDTRCKEFNTGFMLKNGVVETIDLSLKKPKIIKMSNCISARNDRSISNLKGEGSGVIESWCVAMRGRNPEKPTSRKAGLPTEQRLEKAPERMVNTLTTVQKDNLVLEQNCVEIKQATYGNRQPIIIDDIYNSREIRIYEDNSPCLRAEREGLKVFDRQYRIRKLTPRECWRLMGYTDADFDKAEKVNSATQLYKQAGNAIVKQVLMAIFKQMLPEKK